MALRDAREEQQELEALHRLDEECVHQQRAGNYLKAFDCMERALVLRRHFFGIESEVVTQACRALAEMCNLLAMSFLQQDNYAVTIDLLKKAEVLTQRHHPAERATTLNNLACYYRRLGKLHSAMTSLKRALELEKRLENVRNAADTQLNMCAVLSQLGKHQEALEHAQEALITLQEGFIHGKHTTDTTTDNSSGDTSTARLDRVSVMCIAYHNIGVEQEFLKDCAESVASYKKGIGLAEQYLGADHSITTTIRNSYLAAKRSLVSKVRAKPGSASRDQKSPAKAGARLLLSPRSGSLRMPSPLAKGKDRGLQIPTPRSIVADALSRAPMSALPPLDIQSPTSASKKKKKTEVGEVKSTAPALSPTDPFFSPRFRFDSETTEPKTKKLTSIASPRSAAASNVEVRSPSSKGKRERRKSSVKKPPSTSEAGRRTSKAATDQHMKTTSTPRAIEEDVNASQDEKTRADGGEVSDDITIHSRESEAVACTPLGEKDHDARQSEEKNCTSEVQNAGGGDMLERNVDGTVAAVLTNTVDKVAKQEEDLHSDAKDTTCSLDDGNVLVSPSVEQKDDPDSQDAHVAEAAIIKDIAELSDSSGTVGEVEAGQKYEAGLPKGHDVVEATIIEDVAGVYLANDELMVVVDSTEEISETAFVEHSQQLAEGEAEEANADSRQECNDHSADEDTTNTGKSFGDTENEIEAANAHSSEHILDVENSEISVNDAPDDLVAANGDISERTSDVERSGLQEMNEDTSEMNPELPVATEIQETVEDTTVEEHTEPSPTDAEGDKYNYADLAHTDSAELIFEERVPPLDPVEADQTISMDDAELQVAGQETEQPDFSNGADESSATSVEYEHLVQHQGIESYAGEYYDQSYMHSSAENDDQAENIYQEAHQEENSEVYTPSDQEFVDPTLSDEQQIYENFEAPSAGDVEQDWSQVENTAGYVEYYQDPSALAYENEQYYDEAVAATEYVGDQSPEEVESSDLSTECEPIERSVNIDTIVQETTAPE